MRPGRPLQAWPVLLAVRDDDNQVWVWLAQNDEVPEGLQLARERRRELRELLEPEVSRESGGAWYRGLGAADEVDPQDLEDFAIDLLSEAFERPADGHTLEREFSAVGAA